ncbi:hypothetical protein [Paludisphaera borealis]|uniref:Uncharacterized protein n=1 Tax=Paludisphaera borealis TaxID=1387353 RepID=A0A1U7CUF9_9BACT|nr:hypothetical protein [Paludisphaera borealis]APW62536.1 hypothetical protein BSF38_04084 [Paludisphaera borealis]
MKSYNLKTAMIAIAVVAVLCGSEVMRRRSARFKRLAAMYAGLEADHVFRASVADAGEAFAAEKVGQGESGRSSEWKEQRDWWSMQRKRNRNLAASYRLLKDLCLNATRSPWNLMPPVEPDIPAERLLPPPDLPLQFTTDPVTLEMSPY